MKKARMNISHSRFILFKLKIFGEIVTTQLSTVFGGKQKRWFLAGEKTSKFAKFQCENAGKNFALFCSYRLWGTLLMIIRLSDYIVQINCFQSTILCLISTCAVRGLNNSTFKF